MLENSFFKRDTIEVAKDLLGKKIIRNISGNFLYAKIVETEAYTGFNDKASHSYGGKITKRTKTLYLDGGHIYVYLIYGMYDLLNFVTKDTSHPEAVLIRAVEPLGNFDDFSKLRFNKKYEELSSYEKRNITNGPGKLTKAFGIDRSLNGKLLSKDYLYVENYDTNITIETDKRIGVDYAAEDAYLPYRFYIKDNKYVTKFK